MLCATFGSIMMNILYVIIAIVVLLTMVLIHELGHYVAGRILGFKIVEFSIGFGKAIWQTTNKRGEKISLRIFPLGGFCAFLGENDDEDDDKNKEHKDNKDDSIVDVEPVKVEDLKPAEQVIVQEKVQEKSNENTGKFNDQKPWKRIIVYFAGVTFNFISAFLFAIIFLCVGGYDGYVMSPTEGYAVQYYSVETTQALGELQDNTIVYAINGTEINYARGNVFT